MLQNYGRLIISKGVKKMELDWIENEINGLKSLLAETDYKDMKLVEALAQGKDISEFEEIMAKRQSWRDQINALEIERDSNQNTQI